MRISAIAAAVAAALSTTAYAADPAEAVATVASSLHDEGALEQVIVTGTRRTERTVLESNVPIDVVSANDLRKTSTADINNKLQAVVPSYNVRRIPTADGSIFVRPATLRNLSPDHTLVLVNGRRFHRSAFVDVTARGAQAVNLALLPAGAFKRTEVLRDGAAAQYGSDAIAGVINIVLKGGASGASVSSKFGLSKGSFVGNTKMQKLRAIRFQHFDASIKNRAFHTSAADRACDLSIRRKRHLCTRAARG